MKVLQLFLITLSACFILALTKIPDFAQGVLTAMAYFITLEIQERKENYE